MLRGGLGASDGPQTAALLEQARATQHRQDTGARCHGWTKPVGYGPASCYLGHFGSFPQLTHEPHNCIIIIACGPRGAAPEPRVTTWPNRGKGETESRVTAAHEHAVQLPHSKPIVAVPGVGRVFSKGFVNWFIRPYLVFYGAPGCMVCSTI